MSDRPRICHHGVTHAVGCSHAGFAPFTRMFPNAAPLNFDDDLLDALGAPGGLMHDERRDSADSNVPAGYTFFAQFIDHDLTLDTGSKLNTPEDKDGKRELNVPETLKNQRTPTLDLDCVYGLGPEATPHLYDQDRERMLADGAAQGRPWDLARTPTGSALIGDPRNDENIFVSQMQLLWIRFHNLMLLTNPGSGNTAAARFEAVQTRVRHHYQYIVLYDLLRRICHPQTYWATIPLIKAAAEEKLTKLKQGESLPLPTGYPLVFRKRPKAHAMPMPVEFSVAAYRFGHTTVRDAYPVNVQHADIELFDERFMAEGFAPLPRELEVDWRFLLEVDPCVDPVRTKAFDHLLPDELIRMPDPIVGRTSDRNRSLAFRNLVRGRSFGLPSGEAAAAALRAAGYSIGTGDVLKLNELPEKRSLVKLVSEKIANDKTPLFFYLMREAATEGGGNSLGPVGSAILLEVFGRILLGCTSSFFFHKVGKEYVPFEPEPCVTATRNSCCHDSAPGKGNGPRKHPPFADGHEPPALELADVARFVNRTQKQLGLHQPAADVAASNA